MAGYAFGQYSVTNTFVASTPAKASDVNANFQDLVDACNDLRTDLDAISSGQWVDGTAGAIYYNGGNVGIGTASPGDRLTVNGDLGGTGITVDSSTGAGIVVDKDSSGYFNGLILKTGDVLKWQVGGAGDDNFHFYNGSNSFMFINQVSGNVGIGTITPTEKLDVVGTVKATGFQLTTTPAAGYVLTADASGVGSWQPAGAGSSQWTLSGSDIYYAAGNVGIGVTSPESRLDVAASVP